MMMKRTFKNNMEFTLSQNLLEQSMEDEFYMYMAFSKPTEELYFSYSLTDSDGTALRPSVLQKNLSCLFPKLNEKEISRGRTKILLLMRKTAESFYCRGFFK
ncbi:MAG: hypothetical protein ACLVIY_13235 [Anaerobutyricum soehngenii]